MAKKRKPNILVHYAGINGLSREAFQRCSGLTPATFNRRMANTDTITIGELRGMLKAIRRENMPDKAVLDLIWEGK